MSKIVQQAVRAMIRPPRDLYDHETVPLYLRAADQQVFCRYPISMRNERGQTIIGSIYHSADKSPFMGGPCVIYLHGNASSQMEGQFLVPNLCPHGVFVVCFDFAGCGCSGGSRVSLGWYEKQDTEYLIDILRNGFNMGPFVVWGRSMGAATSLLINPDLICGRVVDSAFTCVRDMCGTVALNHNVPGYFVPLAIWYLRKKIRSTASFDFDQVSPITMDNIGREVPAVFGHATDDTFIPIEHAHRLHEHYQEANKSFMEFTGGHNGQRDIEWIKLGVSFCLSQFAIKAEEFDTFECRELQSVSRHFQSLLEMTKAYAIEPADPVERDIGRDDSAKQRARHRRRCHRPDLAEVEAAL